MPPATRARVLLVDDTDFGTLLARSLAIDPALDYVGRSFLLEDGLREAEAMRADLVLLRSRVGHVATLPWIARFAARAARARVVVLSDVASELLARESVSRGATGFLVHDVEPGPLLERIRACAGPATNPGPEFRVRSARPSATPRH